LTLTAILQITYLVVLPLHRCCRFPSGYSGQSFFEKELSSKPLKEEEIQVKEDDPEVKKGNIFMSCVDNAAMHYPDPCKSDRGEISPR